VLSPSLKKETNIFFTLDFTMTHDPYGRSKVHTTGKLTHTRSSDETPNPDDVLKNLHTHREASFLVEALPVQSD